MEQEVGSRGSQRRLLLVCDHTPETNSAVIAAGGGVVSAEGSAKLPTGRVPATPALNSKMTRDRPGRILLGPGRVAPKPVGHPLPDVACHVQCAAPAGASR
jgi:hypothetical protein